MSIQLFRPVITEEAIKNVVATLHSGWLGLGPRVEEFEERFADYVGARYAVALNSGTAALHLALLLAGVGPGDEVITTPLTFVSTNHVILYCGAKPVFADVDPMTCNIDPADVERLIRPKTRAILCVHFGGWPCDLYRLGEIAWKHRIPLIEDAAHACGSWYHGFPVGSFGLTCFSFHAVKNLPVGDGGMLTVPYAFLAARARRLRWLGIDKTTFDRTRADEGKYAWQYEVTELGYKYHMNDIAASIGLAQLKALEVGNGRRREIAAMYDREIQDQYVGFEYQVLMKCPLSNGQVVSAQHLYWLQVRRRDKLVAKLKENGIAPGVHYKPSNEYPMYANGRATPKAHMCAERLISLPMHLGLTDDDVGRVIEGINRGW